MNGKDGLSHVSLLLLPLLLALLAKDAESFGSGAPKSACASMAPLGHGRNQAAEADLDGLAPYDLYAEPLPQLPGNVVVTLSATNSSRPFRGFLIMARDEVLGGERGHGYFRPIGEGGGGARLLDCAGLPASCADPSGCTGDGNAATHGDPTDKESVSVLWEAPYAGSFSFVATVVRRNDRKGSIWYSNVDSVIVAV